MKDNWWKRLDTSSLYQIIVSESLIYIFNTFVMLSHGGSVIIKFFRLLPISW